MSQRTLMSTTFALVAALAATGVPAQQLPYGPTISLENVKKAAAAAIEEARKNNFTMAVAVVDPAGTLIYFEKMDNTQNASSNIAIKKARAAALFKRATKAFQDDVAAGGVGLRYLGFDDVIPSEGGVPIVLDGRIVGAMGASGGSGAQDGQVVKAGLDALK